MNNSIKEQLVEISKQKQSKTDPSHDHQHILRVTNLAEIIAKKEKADLDIIVPASLFHDVVVYPKNDPKSKNEAEESSIIAMEVLKTIKDFPQDKIDKVALCINQCSFRKNIKSVLLEAKILQDADRLEATGAIAIMRTFASAGQMNMPFYDPSDPFCENGSIPFRSALDLFYDRLLLVENGMHTKYPIPHTKLTLSSSRRRGST